MGTCTSCRAPLAVDQRWCIECGERRGPVAAAMQALIAPPIVAAPTEIRRSTFALPTPRAAAVAITALLGFGVMLGSLVSPTAQSAAESPLIVAVSRPAAAAPAPAPAVDEEPAGDEIVEASAPVEVAAAPQQEVIYLPADEPPPAAPAPPKPLPIPPLPPLPSVAHVFLIVLSGHGYDAAFGPESKAPYLSKTLTTQGELIPNYYAVTRGGLANEIAMISGQGPNPQTAADCPKYSDLAPGTPGDKDQAIGEGCVFPETTKTLADQLVTQGNTWKAYVEDLGKAAGDPAQTCRHPEIGSDDPNREATAESPYATWRNPFLYFHSLIDSPGCATNIADLAQLPTDLQQVADVPALSYIVPNRCHDGSETQCVPDGPSGLAAADAWLQSVIPQIQQSPGYTQGGLIAITFDEAPAEGPEADSRSCCAQPEQYPNMPAADPAAEPAEDPSAAPADPADAAFGVKKTGGGGKVGLLLMSPYIKPNTVNTTSYYNHFSLFASIEDLFNTGNIAYANLPDLTRFDKTTYSAYNTSGG